MKKVYFLKFFICFTLLSITVRLFAGRVLAGKAQQFKIGILIITQPRPRGSDVSFHQWRRGKFQGVKYLASILFIEP